MMHADERPLRRRFEDRAREYLMSPKMQAAVHELSALIRSKYPEAQFALGSEPDDPAMTVLWATVDADDLDEVADLFIARMGELRTEEGVPILVVPLHTPERVAAMLAAAPAPMPPAGPPAALSERHDRP